MFHCLFTTENTTNLEVNDYVYRIVMCITITYSTFHHQVNCHGYMLITTLLLYSTIILLLLG